MLETIQGKASNAELAEMSKNRLAQSLEMIRHLRSNPIGKSIIQLQILQSVERRITTVLAFFKDMTFRDENEETTTIVYNLYSFAGNVTIVIGNFNANRLDECLDRVNKRICDFIVLPSSVVHS